MKHKDAAGYYKVINLFAATVMGLEGQISRRYKKVEKKDKVIEDLETRINIVQVARRPLSEAYESMEKVFAVDDHQRKIDINKANTNDLMKVYNSLRKRWISAHKRTYKVHRDELSEYLMLLKFELDGRNIKYLDTPINYVSNSLVQG
jgi:predicted Holliday junction resolvase-like endonuclease